jgi:hypothetical protein
MPAVDDGGIRINKMKVIPIDAPSLNSFIKRYEYRVKGQGLWVIGNLKPAPIIVKRDGKDVDISSCIEDVQTFEESNELVTRLVLRDSDNIKVRIGEIAEAIFGMSMNELEITRTALYGWNNEWVEPL